jgi:hypothetical protein
MHQPAAARDLVFGATQGDFRHRLFRPIREVSIERTRESLPEARRLIDRNGAHRGIFHCPFRRQYMCSRSRMNSRRSGSRRHKSGIGALTIARGSDTSGEVVGRDQLLRRRPNLWNRRNALWLDGVPAARFDESSQHRQCRDLVAGVRSFVARGTFGRRDNEQSHSPCSRTMRRIFQFGISSSIRAS